MYAHTGTAHMKVQHLNANISMYRYMYACKCMYVCVHAHITYIHGIRMYMHPHTQRPHSEFTHFYT